MEDVCVYEVNLLERACAESGPPYSDPPPVPPIVKSFEVCVTTSEEAKVEVNVESEAGANLELLAAKLATTLKASIAREVGASACQTVNIPLGYSWVVTTKRWQCLLYCELCMPTAEEVNCPDDCAGVWMNDRYYDERVYLKGPFEELLTEPTGGLEPCSAFNPDGSGRLAPPLTSGDNPLVPENPGSNEFYFECP